MPKTPQADAIVLFGGTGDLARRMLLASLYFLDVDGFLPEGFRIVATARAEMTREAFVDLTHKTLEARPEGLDAPGLGAVRRADPLRRRRRHHAGRRREAEARPRRREAAVLLPGDLAQPL